MTHHQYQSISGQIAAWGLLILGSVSQNVWVSVFLLSLGAIQTGLNAYWHFKVKKEKT
jgi:hypothetical protein